MLDESRYSIYCTHCHACKSNCIMCKPMHPRWLLGVSLTKCSTVSHSSAYFLIVLYLHFLAFAIRLYKIVYVSFFQVLIESWKYNKIGKSYYFDSNIKKGLHNVVFYEQKVTSLHRCLVLLLVLVGSWFCFCVLRQLAWNWMLHSITWSKLCKKKIIMDLICGLHL